MADSESPNYFDLEMRMAFQERHHEKMQQELVDLERRLASAEGRIATLQDQLKSQSGAEGTDQF
ncbi:MAG: SlyX family protein [Planctomycetota bacterium]|nr:SlyX family protein [Planctomycetota bacterium]